MVLQVQCATHIAARQLDDEAFLHVGLVRPVRNHQVRVGHGVTAGTECRPVHVHAFHVAHDVSFHADAGLCLAGIILRDGLGHGEAFVRVRHFGCLPGLPFLHEEILHLVGAGLGGADVLEGNLHFLALVGVQVDVAGADEREAGGVGRHVELRPILGGGIGDPHRHVGFHVIEVVGGVVESQGGRTCFLQVDDGRHEPAFRRDVAAALASRVGRGFGADIFAVVSPDFAAETFCRFHVVDGECAETAVERFAENRGGFVIRILNFLACSFHHLEVAHFPRGRRGISAGVAEGHIHGVDPDIFFRDGDFAGVDEREVRVRPLRVDGQLFPSGGGGVARVVLADEQRVVGGDVSPFVVDGMVEGDVGARGAGEVDGGADEVGHAGLVFFLSVAVKILESGDAGGLVVDAPFQRAGCALADEVSQVVREAFADVILIPGLCRTRSLIGCRHVLAVGQRERGGRQYAQCFPKLLHNLSFLWGY